MTQNKQQTYDHVVTDIMNIFNAWILCMGYENSPKELHEWGGLKKNVETAIKTNSTKKKLKDPNAPKHPLTSYMAFTKEKRSSMSSGDDQKNIMVKIGQMWRETKDRTKFDRIAEKDKKRHNEEMKTYNRPNDEDLEKLSVNKKKKKRVKAPKKPVRGYMFHRLSRKVELKNTGLSDAEILALISTEWKEIKLDPDNKYTKSETIDRERYSVEMKNFEKNKAPESDSEPETEEEPKSSPKTARKSTRKTGRQEPEPELESETEEEPKPKSSPKTTRKSKSKSKSKTGRQEPEPEPELETEEEPKSSTKTARKPKSTRKTGRQEPEPEPESETEEEPKPTHKQEQEQESETEEEPKSSPSRKSTRKRRVNV
jgi:hypothetical protein